MKSPLLDNKMPGNYENRGYTGILPPLYKGRMNKYSYYPKGIVEERLNTDGNELSNYSQKVMNLEPINQNKIRGKLISEKYSPAYDPKYNTEVQRTWICYRDPGLKAIQDLPLDNTKNKLSLPKGDNYMSLSINTDSEYSKQQQKTLIGCPKKRSDISKNTFHVFDLRKYN